MPLLDQNTVLPRSGKCTLINLEARYKVGIVFKIHPKEQQILPLFPYFDPGGRRDKPGALPHLGVGLDPLFQRIKAHQSRRGKIAADQHLVGTKDGKIAFGGGAYRKVAGEALGIEAVEHIEGSAENGVSRDKEGKNKGYRKHHRRKPPKIAHYITKGKGKEHRLAPHPCLSAAGGIIGVLCILAQGRSNFFHRFFVRPYVVDSVE